MKIAVFSDIHGNYNAFKRCLEYSFSQNITNYIFLGDYVGELAYPQKTMQMIYDLDKKYNCYFIKGNKEDYWINYHKNKEEKWQYNNSTTGSLIYTFEKLNGDDLMFFENLDFVSEVDIDGYPNLTLCHGSPYKVNEKMLPDDIRTSEIADKNINKYILCGHTHIQMHIPHKEKIILNPGSVGLPLYSNGKTQFMILDGNNNKWQHQFISLEYDVDETINDLYKEELHIKAPYWCIVSENMLRYGNISHAKVLDKAMEICKDKYGKCIYPDIPEECWKNAVENMLSI